MPSNTVMCYHVLVHVALDYCLRVYDSEALHAGVGTVEVLAASTDSPNCGTLVMQASVKFRVHTFTSVHD